MNDKDIIASDVQTLIEKNTPKDYPLYIQFEDYKTNFVTIRMFLSTREVDTDFLPYIDVFFSELFSLPILLEDGKTTLSLRTLFVKSRLKLLELAFTLELEAISKTCYLLLFRSLLKI